MEYDKALFEKKFNSGFLKIRYAAFKNGVSIFNETFDFDNFSEAIENLENEVSFWKDHSKKDNIQISTRFVEFITKIKFLFVDIAKLDVNNTVGFSNLARDIYNDNFSKKMKDRLFNVKFDYNSVILNIALPSITHDKEKGIKYLSGFDLLKGRGNIHAFFSYVSLINNSKKLADFLSNGNIDEIEAAAVFFKQNIFDNHPEMVVDGINLETTLQNIQKEKANLTKLLKQEKTNFIDYSNSLKEEVASKENNELREYTVKVESIQENLKNFVEEKKNRIESLERTYNEKLSLQEPAQFWSSEAKKSKISAIIWIIFSVAIGLLIIVAGFCFLKITQQDYSNKEIIKVVPIYFAPLALISLLLYLLRTSINIAISSRHVAIEYEQKSALTNYYLSMLQSGKIKEEEKGLVLPALFSKIDTGLAPKSNSSTEDQLQSLLSLLLRQRS
ncbi:hypothetical protein JK197_14040 [Lactiplantibacillus plantarum]|uniref:DUF6161 domain-containing protein n=1 Tax=Lactiplantibacillus plantarum TaxID=1590 RepID=UPI001BA884B6|nr:DUF6161 domain-containing protein [Lactiplantibacillus plantarum]MBS0940854.1 hypothetical protein [Lactiplantibacillus plantarum]MCG0690867.1 hypothetical protein [Lactiplantibacillus plantarum]MCG0942096.1 hypothetical protein [Lactiplantibacillus plantarum]BEI51716.1 hypothetical protein AWA2013_31220 [Lactiplantibacillus plantarum]